MNILTLRVRSTRPLVQSKAPPKKRRITPLRAAALLGFVSVAFGLTGVGCDCTLAGCLDSVGASFPVANLADFDGATVEACLNDACSNGTITLANGVLDCGFDSTTLRCTSATNSGDLEVTLLIDGDAAEDGDHASVVIVDANGAALGSREGDVTYETSAPNGELCGPTCHNAEI